MKKRVGIDINEENLNRIANPEDVNIIKPVLDDDNWGIWARLNGGETIKIANANEQIFGFQQCPLVDMFGELSDSYWEEFLIIGNKIAINRTHVEQVSFVKNRKYVSTYAYFDDGGRVLLTRSSGRVFANQVKSVVERGLNMEFKDDSKVFNPSSYLKI